MEQTVQEFFHDFRQELMAGAEANSDFQLAEFMEAIANELMETGFVEEFEFCHFRAQRGMRVDGYAFNDEGVLDLFIADFDSRNELASLTQTEVRSSFKRLVNFFETSWNKNLYRELEETSPEYGLSREIVDRKELIRQVNFYLLSERELSGRLKALDDNEISGVRATYHVWDMSRLQRQRSSRDKKEALNIDFQEMFGSGISCLPAHLGANSYRSYLVVMPGEMLANLYDKFGARLLEQNVRTFLQARGNVNKGIRSTILNEPGMFFAYNNGITATAQEVDTESGDFGLQISRIRDLQIVNGGQTTASMFHTRRKDKASLENVFVQMKLSVIASEESEAVVPRISEYANTQNRVNAADFFSNHPFHIRIEEFSRRIWAPAQQGAQRETRWFYERARGQYADAQSKMTDAEKRRFLAEHPKPQMFTKTDLAKFQNTWRQLPHIVSLGAQKNFGKFAQEIGNAWNNDPTLFNELYFKHLVAKAMLFKRTEKIVMQQPWYQGGYRANIVTYTLALLSKKIEESGNVMSFDEVWKKQGLSEETEKQIADFAAAVHGVVTDTPEGISNVTEWCKKEQCWKNIQGLEVDLNPEFNLELQFKEAAKSAEKDAKKTQGIDDGINAQRTVVEYGRDSWAQLYSWNLVKNVLSPKEVSILKIATMLPSKIPSPSQSSLLLKAYEKCKMEGFNFTDR